jgi:hypothetical protein
MRALSTAFLVAATVSSTPAGGAPLEVRNGQRIRISLAGHRESALALPATARGWRLDLSRLHGTLRLSDVTVGAAPSTMELNVAGKGVVLDPSRFRPDHAYRIELRQGLTVVGAAFIYLKPPPRQRGPIRFSDGETSAVADSEMAVVAKGTL